MDGPSSLAGTFDRIMPHPPAVINSPPSSFPLNESMSFTTKSDEQSEAFVGSSKRVLENDDYHSPTVSQNFACDIPSTEDRLEELRCFVAPLSKEQLVDLVAKAALAHDDIYSLCTYAVSASPAARRLMIRNIPFSTSDATFVALFQQFGEIDDALIVREKDGRSRGYGFVTYKNLNSVRDCLQSELHIDGKELFVKLAADTYADRSQRKLFIRNLPDSATEEMLRIVFSQFGKLEECSVVKSKEGVSKGYGFLTFSTHREAFRAVQQQERVIDHRVVFIHFATPPPDKRKDGSGNMGNARFGRGGLERGGRSRGMTGGTRRGNANMVNNGGTTYGATGGNSGRYRVEHDRTRSDVNGVAGNGMYPPFTYAFTPNVYHVNPTGLPIAYTGGITPGAANFYTNGPGGRY